MTSTQLLDRRFARILLLGGVVALALTGLLAGLHVACVHADDDAAAHGCVICRHLDDSPLPADPVGAMNVDEVVAVVVADTQLDLDHLPCPSRHGRAPPIHVL